ncbi:MAG: hypothetical protein FK733_11575 [Asgard group archaeon]|nr:hypothetical protein [Asgard group archaeon]
MSENEEKSPEEIEKELAFYRNQTQVLREKNRDLRNALLLAESQEGVETPKETTEDSLSDIRKIISDSKKQITEKLSQFKEDIDKSDTPPTAISGAPTTGKHELTTEASTAVSADVEVLSRQCEYLKEEIERLENFLEQSEMVNNRLRDLLTKHNIDVSEISKAISEASKTAVSQKAVVKPEASEPVIPEPVIRQPVEKAEVKEKASAVVEKPKPKPEPKRELSPEVAKLFKDLRAKLSTGIGDEDIKMEILNFREKLMDLIPHSRVFYEMQVEYRRWKRGTSSTKQLQDVMNEWEKTIASM